MNKNERLEIARWSVQEAKKYGANEAAATIYKFREISVDYRDKKIEKLKESTQNSLSISIYTNQKYSSHKTNDIRKEKLSKFIEEAVASTKYLSEDEYRSLPDPKLYPRDLNRNLQIFDPEFEKVETEKRVALTKRIEETALSQSDKIISVSAGCRDYKSEFARVHSNGFEGEAMSTGFYFGCSTTVNDPNGGKPSAWNGATTRFYKDLPDPDKIAIDSANRALQKIGQKKIKSGKYDMIVENWVGGRMFATLYAPISARALQQKRSFLEGCLDKKIASEKLTISEDPFILKGLSSRLFDEEGIATKKRPIIENGTLKTYLLDNYYGKKLGLEPNGGSVSNITFDLGAKSFERMVKEMKKGIIVNGFIGGNSNSTTGDFSFGVVGFYVENGEIVTAINEMNISGNSKEIFHQISEIGNDPYQYSSQRVPSILYENVEFSGI